MTVEKKKQLLLDLDAMKSVVMDKPEVNGYFLFVSLGSQGDRGLTRYDAVNWMSMLGLLDILLLDLRMSIVETLNDNPVLKPDVVKRKLDS